MATAAEKKLAAAEKAVEKGNATQAQYLLANPGATKADYSAYYTQNALKEMQAVGESAPYATWVEPPATTGGGMSAADREFARIADEAMKFRGESANLNVMGAAGLNIGQIIKGLGAEGLEAVSNVSTGPAANLGTVWVNRDTGVMYRTEAEARAAASGGASVVAQQASSPAQVSAAQAEVDRLQAIYDAAAPGSAAQFRAADNLSVAQYNLRMARESQAAAGAGGGGAGGGAGAGGVGGPLNGGLSTGTAAPAYGGPTLAIDTFRNSLALFFGNEAKSAAWVNDLYNVVSNYYKTGSTMSESLNMALQDARNNPALKRFTDRFKGVYALQDRLQKGEAVYVPTIAEYTQIQTKMADVFNAAGLGELSSLEFTGDLIGRNLSATTVSNYITDVFDVIDNADTSLKQTFSEYFPMLTRSDLAKSLLLGDQGVQELEQKVKGIQVKSAAQQQGLVATDPFNLAKMGVTYAQAQKGYAGIAQALPTMQALETIYGEGPSTGAAAQQTLESATFGGKGSAAAQKRVRRLAAEEQAAFSGSAGVGKTSLTQGDVAGML